MLNDIAISVRNVSKCYRVFDDQRTRVLHALWPRHTKGTQQIWALKDINFEVRRGESVAIIGRNGGGKSTLLEILTRTLAATTGEVTVNGRVSALLELGSGFNPEYSGRDNVILNGLLLGLSREEILRRFDEIEAFAEIGIAIDRAVKSYSTGMMMRLAFAVQVLCDPDILIIDEALSVGDIFFQQKCFKRINEIREQGTTVLFVSHDMGMVRDLCERVVYLRQGKMVFQGEPHAGIQQYLSEDRGVREIETNPQSIQSQKPSVSNPAIEEYLMRACWISPDWNGPAARTRIFCIVVEDEHGQSTQLVQVGGRLKFYVLCQVAESSPVHVSIVLKNRYDQIVNCTSTYTLGMEVPLLEPGSLAVLEIQMDMMLEAGEYTFFVNLGWVGDQPNRGEAIDETPWLGPIAIRWEFDMEPAPFLGMFGLPAVATLSRLLPGQEVTGQ